MKKWIAIVAGAVLLIALLSMTRKEKDVNAQMKKVRAAKAKKARERAEQARAKMKIA